MPSLFDPPIRRATFATAVLGVALALGLAPSPAPAQSPGAQHAMRAARAELSGVVVEGRRLVLASEARVLVAAADSAAGRAALDRAFAAADSVEKLLSRFHRDSEINAINDAAGVEPVAVSPWTELVVAEALLWAERSGGAFDPTVGPVAELWGFGRTTSAPPDEADLARVRQRVGWDRVVHDPEAHTVFLPDSGMILDLRAAAKGFALDRIREALLETGITSGIIDLEGDMLFFGPGPSDDGRWPVGLPNPYEPDHSFATFRLGEGSIASSAALDRAIVVQGVRHGHLIDPRTGWPVASLAGVSVYSRSGMTSDILATTLYVLGPDDGPAFVESWPGVEAVFVSDVPEGGRSFVVVTEGLEPHRERLEPPFRPRVPPDEY